MLGLANENYIDTYQIMPMISVLSGFELERKLAELSVEPTFQDVFLSQVQSAPTLDHPPLFNSFLPKLSFHV